jgi:hypothetical protein
MHTTVNCAPFIFYGNGFSEAVRHRTAPRTSAAAASAHTASYAFVVGRGHKCHYRPIQTLGTPNLVGA